MLVDTGHNGPYAGFLNPRIFGDLLSARQLELVGTSYVTAMSRTRGVAIGRTSDVAVGTLSVSSPIFARGPISILGLGYLSRFTVTFDFPNNVLYLRPGKRFTSLEHPNRSGLHLIRVRHETIVHTVDVGSPAEVCGIRANDRLLSIDGAATSTLTMYEVRSGLHIEHGRLSLRLKRGNDELDVLLEVPRMQHGQALRPGQQDSDEPRAASFIWEPSEVRPRANRVGLTPN